MDESRLYPSAAFVSSKNRPVSFVLLSLFFLFGLFRDRTHSTHCIIPTIMRFYLLIASTVAAMAAAADTKQLHLVLPAELEASKADSETPMLQHYGKPPECDADEQAFSIQGIPGAVSENLKHTDSHIFVRNHEN